MSSLQSIKSWARGQAKRQNTAKGDRFESAVEAFLLARDFVVERTKMNKRMIRRGGRSAWITIKADFFGCIDFIALHAQVEPTLLIQATSAPGEVGRKKREIDAAIPAGLYRNVEIWVPSDLPEDFSGKPDDFGVHVRSLTAPFAWSFASSAAVLYAARRAIAEQHP